MMVPRLGEWLLAGICLTAATRLPAQVRQERGVQLVGVTGRPAALVAGPAWAWRPGIRDRLVLHAGVGAAEHQLAVRGEILWQFLLEPSAVRGVGVYVGAGFAGQTAETTRGWIVAAIGVEARPAGRSGWTMEVGVGGGVRVALGYRWRR